MIDVHIDTEGWATLTIDMPDRAANVWNAGSLDAFAAIVDRIATDDAIAGVVITSAKKTFLAGADLDSLLQGGLLLTGLDRGDAPLYRTHAVEILVEFLLVDLCQSPAQVPGAANYAVEHLPVQWVSLGDAALLAALAEEPVQDIARINLGWDGWRGRAVAAIRVVPFVQARLIFLPWLGHRRQL